VLVSGYPDVQSAVSTILLQADENHGEAIRIRQTRDSSAKDAKSEAGRPINQGESGRDTAALHTPHVEKWLARAKRSDD